MIRSTKFGVLGWSLVWATFAGGTGLGWAHHPGDLVVPEGTRPCIDARSVTATVDAPEGRAVGSTNRLAERLGGEIAPILRGIGAPASVRETCRDSDAYVRLDLAARYLDPDTYLNFPPSTYSVRTSLRIGPFEALADAPPTAPVGNTSSGFTTADLHSEAESGVAVDRRLLTDGRRAVVELAEATAAASARPSPLAAPPPPVVIGIFVSLVALAVAVPVRVLRRRTSQTPSPRREPT